MPEVAFVMSTEQPPFLRELADALTDELSLQAVPGAVHLAGFPESRNGQVYVLLDPCSYVQVEGENALPDDAILRRTIFVCAQAPPAGAEQAALLRRAGSVFVLDQRSVVAMRRLGIAARLLRPGYSRALDHFDPDAARPIDVAFIGTRSPRRTMYLDRSASVLTRHNCLVHTVQESAAPAAGGWLLGQARRSVLAQTKVLINLHYGEDSGLEWLRVLDAIHAGAVVVSEHSSAVSPLVPGEHLLVAGPDALPFVADALLRDPERLASLRARAYERLSNWMPFALPVSVLRAAIVELVGEPVPPGASLGTTRSRPDPPHVPQSPPVELGVSQSD